LSITEFYVNQSDKPVTHNDLNKNYCDTIMRANNNLDA